MNSSRLLAEIRERLADENRKILDHNFIKDAELGKLDERRIKLFVAQQNYIVTYDLRSLALMLVRSGSREEADFFHTLISGDLEASKQLVTLSEELGITQETMGSPTIIPEAVAYTHYIAWLALYANAGEQAMALIVNLPVWGGACKRLGDALRERYGFRSLGFFEAFSGPFDPIEKAALKVIDRYVERQKAGMERCAKMIQRYELMFWDGVYRGG